MTTSPEISDSALTAAWQDSMGLQKTIKAENREAWLAERRNGLGASNAAAAIGADPFCSAFKLWATLCGLLPPEDLAAENESVEWGLRHEANVLQAFSEKTGREVFPNPGYEMVVHPDLPWLRTTLDATQLSTHRPDKGDLQAKTADARMMHEWKDGISPLQYQVQVQIELAVTGMQWGSLAVLIGGNRFRWLDFERDDAFISAVIPHLEKFWWHVENRIEPEIDGSASTAKILARLHPNDNGETVALPPEATRWHAELIQVKEKLKALEELKTLNENRLKAAIGDGTYGLLSDGTCYSFKTQQRAEHSVKASEFRVLKITKGR